MKDNIRVDGYFNNIDKYTLWYENTIIIRYSAKIEITKINY